MIRIAPNFCKTFNGEVDRFITEQNLRSFRNQISAYSRNLTTGQIRVYIGDYVVRFGDLEKSWQEYINACDDTYSVEEYLRLPFWKWKLLMVKHFGWTHFSKQSDFAPFQNYIRERFNKKVIKPCLL